MVRPVRIGLVFEPSAEMLRFAVEQATLLWGGQYQPIFQPDDIGWVDIPRAWSRRSSGAGPGGCF
jgi:hypothetical protein